MISTTTLRHIIIESTDVAILAVLVAGVYAKWESSEFQDFYQHRLPMLCCLAAYCAYLLIMPQWKRPIPIKGEAYIPTDQEARSMKYMTWMIEYVSIGAFFFFLVKTCVKDDGSLCPFATGCGLMAMLCLLPMKDDFQLRILFPKFIARAKLNSFPHSWRFSMEQATKILPFFFLIGMNLATWGIIEFPKDMMEQPLWSLVRLWTESNAQALLTDMVGMAIFHAFMHKNCYCLHSAHHVGKADLTLIHSYHFDLLDLVCEFGGGCPLVFATKYALGMNPQLNFLSFFMALWSATNGHSGNPYAVYFFNPILDHFGRPTLCHNLHHTVQNEFFTAITYEQFWDPARRERDIKRYNKVMKTHFPSYM